MTQKWSYSSLKQLITCPKQYQEVKLLKNYIPQENMHSLYGKEVHEALENYVKDDADLPLNYLKFKSMVDVLKGLAGEKYTELKMGLKKDKTYCEFDDEEYWVHGIADLVIVDGDTAFIVDYKTGNPRYADHKQLKLMALMVFAKFEQVNLCKSGLLFLGKNSFMPEDYWRKDIDKLWAAFHGDLKKMELHFETGNWPANPNGLCKRYCPVTTCKYNGDHNAVR